jgi:UDP-N-acetylglucosamine--N-acetylmuramyl-(pentapeptide) pyrophosphoryl-undecaprenol N-acetylglucosamine transferase
VKKVKKTNGGDDAADVLIAAGGTGGHIFPALAFGDWLLEHGKAGRIRYLSGSRPLETEIYRSRGVEPVQLPLSGSPLGSSSAAKSLWRWTALLRAFFQTGVLLTRERPDVCFLFGSYVSLAPLLWCRLLRIPAVMHEQNACAGKATRLAARLGAPVASGWNECRGLRAGSFTPVGVPVRALKKIPRLEAAAALGLDIRAIREGDLVAGVIGGSLGSASLEALVERLSEFKLRGACPPRDLPEFKLRGAWPPRIPPRFKSEIDADAQKAGRFILVVLGDASGPAAPGSKFGSNVHFIGKRWDMTPFYSLCDVVICRAGASTLAEATAYGIPALAVPWMRAADGHQEANALNFARRTGNPLWFEENTDGLDEALRRLLDRRASKEACAAFEDVASSALWRLGPGSRG